MRRGCNRLCYCPPPWKEEEQWQLEVLASFLFAAGETTVTLVVPGIRDNSYVLGQAWNRSAFCILHLSVIASVKKGQDRAALWKLPSLLTQLPRPSSLLLPSLSVKQGSRAWIKADDKTDCSGEGLRNEKQLPWFARRQRSNRQTCEKMWKIPRRNFTGKDISVCRTPRTALEYFLYFSFTFMLQKQHSFLFFFFLLTPLYIHLINFWVRPQWHIWNSKVDFENQIIKLSSDPCFNWLLLKGHVTHV